MALLNNPMGALAAVNGHPNLSNRVVRFSLCEDLRADQDQLEADINALQAASDACRKSPDCGLEGLLTIDGLILIKQDELIKVHDALAALCGGA